MKKTKRCRERIVRAKYAVNNNYIHVTKALSMHVAAVFLYVTTKII